MGEECPIHLSNNFTVGLWQLGLIAPPCKEKLVLKLKWFLMEPIYCEVFMLNWKYLLVVCIASTSAFAKFEIEKVDGKEIIFGKVVLKDTAKTDLEIKSDSDLTVSISPSAKLDKLVFKDEYQIKITKGKQEVVYDAGRFSDATVSKRALSGVEYRGAKEANNQDFFISCYSNLVLKNEKDLKYTKATDSCVKVNPDCKGYTLGTDKKFKYTTVNICTGKKEIEVSSEAIYTEEIVCNLYDDGDKEKIKNGVNFKFSRDLEKTKYVNPTFTSDCK